MDDYHGHLRDFRRLLINLDAQATHPLQRETIAALSQRIDRDEAFVAAERLERSLLSTLDATRSLGELRRTEEDVLSYVRDVTTRRRAELERKRFREAMDHAVEILFIVEPHTGRFEDVNQTACRTLGYSRDEILELSLNHIEVGLPLTPASAWQDWVAKLREQGQMSVLSGMHRRRDGSRFPVDVSVGFATIDDQELLLVVSRDCSERRRRDSRLRRQWSFFSYLVQRSVDGIFAFDRNKTLTYWNPSMEKLLGKRKNEVLGRNVLEALPQWKDLGEDAFLDQALSGQSVTSRNRPFILEASNGSASVTSGDTGGTSKKSRRIYLDGYYSPLTEHDSPEILGGIGFLREASRLSDESERSLRGTIEELEKQKEAGETVMRQLRAEVERMESASSNGYALDGVELLADGVSREVTRLMNGILGQAGLAITEFPVESQTRRSLQAIEQAALSASVLADRLKAFSSHKTIKRERVRLNDLLDELTYSLKVLLNSKTEFEIRLADEPEPEIEGDPSQLRDLLLELTTNAFDSLVGGEGEIAIATGIRSFEEWELRRSRSGGPPKPGAFAFIEVKDGGVGMDDGIRAKCLVPFFGTKQGRPGMGLATVLGIVRAHHATLLIDTEPDRGTTVRILFPTGEPNQPIVRPEAEPRIDITE